MANSVASSDVPSKSSSSDTGPKGGHKNKIFKNDGISHTNHTSKMMGICFQILEEKNNFNKLISIKQIFNKFS